MGEALAAPLALRERRLQSHHGGVGLGVGRGPDEFGAQRVERVGEAELDVGRERLPEESVAVQ